MRKLWALLAGGALMLVGVSATAAPVNTTVTARVEFGAVGTFHITNTGTVSLTGTPTGGQYFVGGGATGSQLNVPASLVRNLAVQDVPVPSGTSTLVSNLILQDDVRNGAGTLSIGGATAQASGSVCPGGPATGEACVSGGGAGGILPVLGQLDIQLGELGSTTFQLGGLGIGSKGQHSTTILIAGGTANAAPFTSETASIGTANGLVTQQGQPHEPLTLVSPTYVLPPGALFELPTVVELSLGGIQVVPEPGTLLLLGTGVAGLALVGRSRKS